MPLDSTHVSAQTLMSTPHYMMAWLKSKHPDAIVARDMWGCTQCLGATFLQEHGYPDAQWGSECGYSGMGDGIITAHPAIHQTINDLLLTSGHITAKLVLDRLEFYA